MEPYRRCEELLRSLSVASDPDSILREDWTDMFLVALGVDPSKAWSSSLWLSFGAIIVSVVICNDGISGLLYGEGHRSRRREGSGKGKSVEIRRGR